MPLLPPVLQRGWIGLDDPQPGQDPASCALRMFDAFWDYYSGCSMLNPATVLVAKGLATAVFVPQVAAAMSAPTPPPVFFLALEGAIRATLAATLTPLTMLPLYAVGMPSPVPLTPLLVPSIAIGLASGSQKTPCRIYVSTAISTWMYSNSAQLFAPPYTPIPLF